MKLAVLNPGGRDPQQSFPDGAGTPDEKLHPPVNYHAFAACTGSSVTKKDKSAARHAIAASGFALLMRFKSSQQR